MKKTQVEAIVGLQINAKNPLVKPLTYMNLSGKAVQPIMLIKYLMT